MKCGYHLLKEDINQIINEKQKIQKENKNINQMITQRKDNQKRKRKKHGKNKINFPPKKYNLNFFNNIELSENNENKNKKESRIKLGNSNSMSKNKIIIIKEIIYWKQIIIKLKR